MAHFAELDNGNKVIRVIVVSNDNCNNLEFPQSELVGIDFLERLFGHRNWKQTSFNSNFRNVYAGIGFEYDSINDCFVNPIIEKTLLETAEEQTYYYITGTTN